MVLVDVVGWATSVFSRVGDLAFYWLALAVALKTAESALLALVWRNTLVAAYPRAKLSFKNAWGGSQGGTAINALTPAHAGTAAMIGIFRSSIPGSSVAGLTAATAVQSVFFTAVGILVVIAAVILRQGTVSKGSPSDETGGFFSSHPVLIPVIVAVAVAALVVLWPRLKPRLLGTWRQIKEGGRVFADRRRYVTQVALPSAASYACRIGVNIVFMAGFGIPITAFTVVLVASSHMLSGLFSITPGGVGQSQALDVATLRRSAAAGDVAAFSITQHAVILIWNVVLGIAVASWAFGFRRAGEMLSSMRRHPREQAGLSVAAVDKDS